MNNINSIFNAEAITEQVCAFSGNKFLSELALIPKNPTHTGMPSNVVIYNCDKIEFKILTTQYVGFIMALNYLICRLAKVSRKLYKDLIRASAIPCFDVPKSGYAAIPTAYPLRVAADALYELLHSRQSSRYLKFLGQNLFHENRKIRRSSKKNADIVKVQISVNDGILGLTTYHYGYLKTLFPYAESNVELYELAMSAIIQISDEMKSEGRRKDSIKNKKTTNHNKRKNNNRRSNKKEANYDSNVKPVISSYGSKYIFGTQYFDPTGFNIQIDRTSLNEDDEKPKIEFVEVFSRTMILSLLYLEHFGKVYCYDKDSSFINFFRLIENNIDAVIGRVKGLLAVYGIITNVSIRCRNSDIECSNAVIQMTDDSKKIKEGIERIIKHAQKSLEDNVYFDRNDNDKILMASYLVLLVGFTHSGNMEKVNLSKAIKYISLFENKEKVIRYTANLLNSRYEDVIVERRNYRSTIIKHKNNPNAVLFVDSPYILPFGIQCGDYSDPFTWKHILDMLQELSDAKCKVVITHSDNLEFEAAALQYGFTKVGYYVPNGFPDRGYITNVYTLNVRFDEAKRVFKGLKTDRA